MNFSGSAMSCQFSGTPALLVLDVQRGFDESRWGTRNNPAAENQIARLIAQFRRTRRPVIHVWHESPSPTGAFRLGTPGHGPKPEATPVADERIYRKTVNSAFIGTELEHDLRVLGIDTVVVVGLTTNHCISTTARMAANLGFATYVVSDATAAFASPALNGTLRAAHEVHDGALSDLRDEFATVVDSDSVMSSLAANGVRDEDPVPVPAGGCA